MKTKSTNTSASLINDMQAKEISTEGPPAVTQAAKADPDACRQLGAELLLVEQAIEFAFAEHGLLASGDCTPWAPDPRPISLARVAVCGFSARQGLGLYGTTGIGKTTSIKLVLQTVCGPDYAVLHVGPELNSSIFTKVTFVNDHIAVMPSEFATCGGVILEETGMASPAGKSALREAQDRLFGDGVLGATANYNNEMYHSIGGMADLSLNSRMIWVDSHFAASEQDKYERSAKPLCPQPIPPAMDNAAVLSASAQLKAILVKAREQVAERVTQTEAAQKVMLGLSIPQCRFRVGRGHCWPQECATCPAARASACSTLLEIPMVQKIVSLAGADLLMEYAVNRIAQPVFTMDDIKRWLPFVASAESCGLHKEIKKKDEWSALAAYVDALAAAIGRCEERFAEILDRFTADPSLRVASLPAPERLALKSFLADSPTALATSLLWARNKNPSYRKGDYERRPSLFEIQD